MSAVASIRSMTKLGVVRCCSVQISNYGTAWTNEVSATSRVALEVPRVSPPSKPVVDSSEKKSPKSKPRDKKGAKTEAEGEPMAEPEAEEEVTAEGETEGSSNTPHGLREDEYVVQDGETLNGAVAVRATTVFRDAALRYTDSVVSYSQCQA